MKYRRVEADSFGKTDSCRKCAFNLNDRDCRRNQCSIPDQDGKLIPFYFIEEKGEEYEPVKAK